MHTSFAKGTPLYIKKKDGTIITDKFCDHKSGKVILESGKSVNISDLSCISIRKLETSTKPKSKIKINFRTKN